MPAAKDLYRVKQSSYIQAASDQSISATPIINGAIERIECRLLLDGKLGFLKIYLAICAFRIVSPLGCEKAPGRHQNLKIQFPVNGQPTTRHVPFNDDTWHSLGHFILSRH